MDFERELRSVSTETYLSNMRNSSANSSSDFPLLSSFMQRTIITKNSSKSTVPLPVNIHHKDSRNLYHVCSYFTSKNSPYINTGVALSHLISCHKTNMHLMSALQWCDWLNDADIPSSSTSSIISCNSSGVGFCPSILITFPNSLVLMQPSSASWMKMSNAALNSEKDTTAVTVWQADWY